MENKSQTIVLSLKYVLLAILTGVLVGIIDTVFGRGLLTISDFRTGHYLYLIPFQPRYADHRYGGGVRWFVSDAAYSRIFFHGSDRCRKNTV